VESALKHLGYFMPRNKVVVNLAPADIRKEGSATICPLHCVSFPLLAKLKRDCSKICDHGRAFLDGELRPIKGVLPIAIQSRKEEFKGFILPKANAKEAAIVNNLEVRAENLRRPLNLWRARRKLNHW